MLGGFSSAFGSALMANLRYALRGLRKSPGFTAIAVVIMGLGIGANTAVFSIVHVLISASLPYRNASDVVLVYASTPDSPLPQWISYPDVRDYRDRSDIFSEVAAVSDGVPLSLLADQGTQFVIGEAYSAEVFSILDIPPALGRSFLPEENEAGSELVAMMSYAEWQRKHGGDPNVLGKTVRINGFPVSIIGVGAEGFQGTLGFIAVDYWLSWGTADAIEPYISLDERGSTDVRMLARLRPGISMEQARARLETISGNLAREYPETHKERKAIVLPATEVRIDPVMDKAAYPLSAFLMIVVGLVLVVACSNLAGLLLTRASSRQKEIAVRLAMGANRGRLVGLFLTESVVLGLLGGALGLLVAFWTAGALLSYEPPLPFAISLNLRLDEKVLAFNLLLSVATGVLFGLAPALRASRCDLVRTIKDDVPSLDLGRRRFTLRNLFVVAQVAASSILLIGAGLFIRTLAHTARIQMGFDTKHTAVAVFDVSRAGYETEEEGRRFIQRYCEQIASSPGVETVALASRIPYGLWGLEKTAVHLPDETPEPEQDVSKVDFASVDEHYFDAMHIPIVRGRSFAREDNESSPSVAIVSESMARQYWDSLDVVGERLILGPLDDRVQAEVVGVSRDSRFRSLSSSFQDQPPLLYLPFAQRYSPVVVVIAESLGKPSAMVPILRRELQELDFRVPLFEAETMEEHMSIVLYVPRVSAFLLSSLGALAMVLAGIGLYGVITFSATQRTREFGIRIALGARANQVVAMILGEGMGLVATGLAVGLLVSALVTRSLSRFLTGISPTDPATFVTVALLLFGVTFVATFAPARRVVRADPMFALRHE